MFGNGAMIGTILTPAPDKTIPVDQAGALFACIVAEAGSAMRIAAGALIATTTAQTTTALALASA